MKIWGAMTASVIFAAAAVGFASPSRADDFSGTYAVTLGTGNPATWTVEPCGGDPFIPCVRVSQTGGESMPFEGEAHLTVGSWIMRAERSDAIVCFDTGEAFPGIVTYSWNAVTLTGQAGIYNPGYCDQAPGSFSAPITLVRTDLPATPAPATPDAPVAPDAPVTPDTGPLLPAE